MKLPLNLVGAFAFAALVVCVGGLFHEHFTSTDIPLVESPSEGSLEAAVHASLAKFPKQKNNLKTIQRGNTLTALENQFIPYGTVLYPVRFNYEREDGAVWSFTDYFYKTAFNEWRWISAQNRIETSPR
jgi:hypothetical protein